MPPVMSRSLAVLCVSLLAVAACGEDPATQQGAQSPPPPPQHLPQPNRPQFAPQPALAGPGSPEQACVDGINAYRRTVGSPPLQRWSVAESCASGESRSDSASGKAHGAFGRCGEMAQDECPGWNGPPGAMIGDCLKMMWAEGPGGGHYDNMKNPNYQWVACGFHTLPDGSVWAVQDFK